jgi:hypothetical protein
MLLQHIVIDQCQLVVWKNVTHKRFFKKNEQKKQKRTVSAFFTRDFVCANLYYYFHLFYSMGLDYLSILYLSISHAIIELCLYNSTNLTISSLCQNV